MNSPTNDPSELEFDYDAVETILADADCGASAAEVQAFFCGQLAAGLKRTDTTWPTALAEMANEGRPLNDDTVAYLQQVFDWTAAEMAKLDTLAPLLLPEEDYPAIDQLEAIVDWSHGFLLGFGLQTGNRVIENEEVKESLGDLVEICRLELAVDDDDETQMALVTLIEHLRVAVQIIHHEMVARHLPVVDPASGKTPTLH